jgi:hypothetical protein
MFTFRYRLYPDQNQQTKLWLHANKENWLYNYFLDQRINHWKINKALSKDQRTKLNCYDQMKQLPDLKKQHPELKEIHS